MFDLQKKVKSYPINCIQVVDKNMTLLGVVFHRATFLVFLPFLADDDCIDLQMVYRQTLRRLST